MATARVTITKTIDNFWRVCVHRNGAWDEALDQYFQTKAEAKAYAQSNATLYAAALPEDFETL